MLINGPQWTQIGTNSKAELLGKRAKREAEKLTDVIFRINHCQGNVHFIGNYWTN